MCNRRSQDAGNLSPLRSLFADGGAGGQAYRCAAAADRTGHAILHTLYGMVPLAKCHRLHGLRRHQFGDPWGVLQIFQFREWRQTGYS